MPKRKRNALARFHTTDATDELASCLDEMEAMTAPVPQKTNGSSSNFNSTKDTAPCLDSTDNSSLLWRKSASEKHPLAKSVASRIQTWNQIFTSTKKDHAGLYPCFSTELARHAHIQQLSTFLLEAREVKMPVFERWLLDSKMEEQRTGDIILSRPTLEYESSQRLVQELEDVGMSNEDATKRVKELCRRAVYACDQLSTKPSKRRKGDRIERESQGRFYDLAYHGKKWKKPFVVKITTEHYHKLEEMFLHCHQTIRFQEKGKPTKALHAFHLIVMTLLVRYSALSGGQLLNDLRGGGMQGAVQAELFQVLGDFFPGPIVECFASPLNCYLPTFGSAFEDLEFHFGSVGSMMDLNMVSGVFEANPPFSPGLMNVMVDKMEESLLQADEQSDTLTFCVIVPCATSSSNRAANRFARHSWERMVESQFCRLHVMLQAREHGYVEGSQHLRPTRYKESNYDTSVILVQSLEARRKSLDTEALETRIRQAFASLHRQELEQRKST